MKAFCLVLLMVCAISAFSIHREFDIEKILADIPEADRLEFMRYHINLGYSLVKYGSGLINNYDDYPAEFSIALYQYSLENLNIEDETVLDALRKVICFDDGTCIDIGDPSIHP